MRKTRARAAAPRRKAMRTRPTTERVERNAAGSASTCFGAVVGAGAAAGWESGTATCGDGSLIGRVGVVGATVECVTGVVADGDGCVPGLAFGVGLPPLGVIVPPELVGVVGAGAGVCV